MAEPLEKNFFRKDVNKPDNIKKMNLIQLKETLAREEALLKNKALLSKLPDKGNSIKTFYEEVQKEIIHREEITDIEAGLKSLNILDTDKHIQKICELEKIPLKERYKPFSTLNKAQELHTERKVFKTMEDWSKCNKPTKLIPLPESLEILKQQDEKVKEEQIKVKHRLLLKLNEDEDSTSGSEGEVSDNEESS